MAEKRRGLGRGLGALISGSPTTGDEIDAERTASVGSPASSNSDGVGQDVAQSTAGGQPTTVDVSRDTNIDSSATEVSRETRKSPANVEAKRTASKSTVTGNGGKTPRSREISDDSNVREESSLVRGKDQERKARPVDMFFAPGRQEVESPDELEDVSSATKRQAPNSRSRRVAVPDVLAQVMQQKDDKGTKGSPPLEDAIQTDEPSTSTPSYAGGPATTDNVPRETLVPVPGATFAEVAVADIHPNRKQPRSTFDEDEMAELVHSIREVGLLQPIVLRPSDEEGAEQYELVMGERRWRAVQAAGLASIPAIIRVTSDTDLLRDALLENLHRSQLNPLEEAAAYQQLLQEFDCTQDELSARIGRSRPQISNTIRLMKLPALVQRRVAAGVLSAGHARALLGLVDTAEMERLAQRIVNEGLSVRATEEVVAMNDGLRRPAREKSPRVTARHERLDYLANSLSDQLDTSVKITLGAKKGRVSIEFGSVEDLNRIMNVISPTSSQ